MPDAVTPSFVNRPLTLARCYRPHPDPKKPYRGTPTYRSQDTNNRPSHTTHTHTRIHTGTQAHRQHSLGQSGPPIPTPGPNDALKEDKPARDKRHGETTPRSACPAPRGAPSLTAPLPFILPVTVDAPKSDVSRCRDRLPERPRLQRQTDGPEAAGVCMVYSWCLPRSSMLRRAFASPNSLPGAAVALPSTEKLCQKFQCLFPFQTRPPPQNPRIDGLAGRGKPLVADPGLSEQLNRCS
ncbi:hypothetical protein LZ32DRAFT_72433 [Colletotrichum eremochloae]|nr:hypothetical protein LZ32DRAFT_72433 [Colletotrichum eremochloae]